MSTYVFGTICYGIALVQGEEYPWDKHPDYIDGWWEDLSGWTEVLDWNKKPSPTKEEADAYEVRRKAYQVANPCPFEHNEYGMYDLGFILAVPGTTTETDAYTPKEFKQPGGAPIWDKCATFMKFLKDHKLITDESSPKWLLSSSLC